MHLFGRIAPRQPGPGAVRSAAMPALDRDATERARLTGYIAASRQVQRRLGVGVTVAALVAAAVLVVSSTIGTLALLGVGIVAVCGFWVTAAHISDWKMQLGRLDARARRASSPRGTAER
ncbi:MAG: hypothetical protein IPL61_34740 [Myxococcales bacterium]|nr:hypothetical protein [Myxococcales bacterium]